MKKAEVRVKEHQKTGLLVAEVDGVSGFFVHAHDEEDLLAKLPNAFESFMRLTGHPVSDVTVNRQDQPGGYFPPHLVAEYAVAA